VFTGAVCAIATGVINGVARAVLNKAAEIIVKVRFIVVRCLLHDGTHARAGGFNPSCYASPPQHGCT
jgi:hypothetical protein